MGLLSRPLLLLPLSLSAALPNVIVFQPDDMYHYDSWSPPANAPGRTRKKQASPGLPNIERLRSEGVELLDAYVASPACGTSRFATLMGIYPSRSNYSRTRTSHDAASGRSDVTIPNTKLAEHDCGRSVPGLLKANKGYRTGMVGKWHLTAFTRGGSDYTYAKGQAEVRNCAFDFAEAVYVENFAADGGFWNDGKSTFTHNMEWVTRKGIDFIESTPEGTPFFLYFNPTAPHTPDVKAALESADCKVTPEGTLPDESTLLNVTGMSKGYASCQAYRKTVLDRGGQDGGNLGAVWIDDAMGALMKTLEARKQLDNTVILFMLDHGMEAKMALFQNGARSAMFMRYPPAGKGKKFAGPVTNLDLGRTVLGLAGFDDAALAAKGLHFDGRNWMQQLEKGPDDSWQQRCLFLEYELDRAVLCGCYKFISLLPNAAVSTTKERAEKMGYSLDNEQLYYFCEGNEEQSEATNVIKEPQHAGMLAKLRDVLACHEARTSFAKPLTWGQCALPGASTTPAPEGAAGAGTTAAPQAGTTAAGSTAAPQAGTTTQAGTSTAQVSKASEGGWKALVALGALRVLSG